MDISIGRIYFENPEEYKKFLSYKEQNCIEKQIRDEIIGTKTSDGIEITDAITEFIFDVEFALYSGMTEIKTADIKETLQAEAKIYKKCNCYIKEKVCEIWVNRKTGTLEGFYPLLNDIRKATVKSKEEEFLGKYIKNLDDIVTKKTANNLFHEIAVLIHKEGIEWGRYKRNYFGINLSKKYKAVFKSSLEYEKDARRYVEEANDATIAVMEIIVKFDAWSDSIIETQILTFEEQLEERMEIKGLSREDAIWEINRRWRRGVVDA